MMMVGAFMAAGIGITLYSQGRVTPSSGAMPAGASFRILLGVGR